MNNLTPVFRYLGLRMEKRETIRQISIAAKIPYMTLNRVMKKLEKQNLIKTERIGKSLVCSLNKDNPITKHYLIIASENFKNELTEKDLTIKRICDIIEEKKTKNFSAILLGLQKKEMEILLIYKSEETIKEIEQELKKTKLNDVILTKFSEEQFKEIIRKKAPIAKRILEDHIILHNPEIFWNIIYEALE